MDNCVNDRKSIEKIIFKDNVERMLGTFESISMSDLVHENEVQKQNFYCSL